MKIQLRFQAAPHAHWHLVVKRENAYANVIVKVLYPEWRDRHTPPPRRITEPDAHRLVETARHALLVQAG